jgi:hypothetical protein
MVGETEDSDAPANLTDKEYYRVSAYYPSLDKVLAEMKSRFDSNDQNILCALGDVVLNLKPASDIENVQIVSEH